MRNQHGGVIFEYIRHGSYLKVSAVDVATGIEASIVADPATDQRTLDKLALQKLNYVMNKKLGPK
ncbi:MAG: hypothetical protein MRY32_07155 [Rickettsiales bacterium]|nr:hypothetical protein [Rickettsiales bacterium]